MRFRANAFLMLALPLSLAAQEPPLVQPQSIPTDLAVALANAGGFGTSGEPQILVGSIPEWVTAKVKVPENWRVLGSAFAGTTFVGVLHVSTNSDSLIAEFDRLQTSLGWMAPPAPYRPPMQGFQFVNQMPAPGPRADQRISRCGEGQLLTAWVSRERALATTIVFRLANASTQPGTTCVPYRPPPGFRQDGPRYPLLFMPQGLTGNDQTCWSARYEGRGGGTSVEVKSSMSLEQLLDHFTKQLEDSGWVRKPGNARMVSRSWTKPDSTGAPRGLTVEVNAYPQDTTCRGVSLNLSERQGSAEAVRIR